MAAEYKNLKRLYFALESAATALAKQWWYSADTRRIGVMESDGTTKRFFWDATRLADTGTTYGSKLIGTPGIPGVTPAGGVADAAATLQAMLAGLAAYAAARVPGTVGKIPKVGTGNALADSILSEASGKLLFSDDTGANLYRLADDTLKTDGAFIAGGPIVSGGDISSLTGHVLSAGDVVAQGKIVSVGAFATPILTTAAATLTLDLTHHTVRTTHASCAVTLPDSTTVPEGTEFYVFPQGNGCSFTDTGSDVFRGLNRDLGLGIEGVGGTINYVAPQKGFMLKTDGSGSWYIWEIA